MRIGSIVINCFEFKRMIAFWQEALSYLPRDPREVDSNDWAVLLDPKEEVPNLAFQARSSRAGHRRSVHLDLYTSRPHEGVQRLVGLGARRYPWLYPADYIVLEDPDGNLFCVVEDPTEKRTTGERRDGAVAQEPATNDVGAR